MLGYPVSHCCIACCYWSALL